MLRRSPPDFENGRGQHRQSASRDQNIERHHRLVQHRHHGENKDEDEGKQQQCASADRVAETRESGRDDPKRREIRRRHLRRFRCLMPARLDDLFDGEAPHR